MKEVWTCLVIALLSGCAKDTSQELALSECQRQLALTESRLQSALDKLEEVNAEKHRDVQTFLKIESAKPSELAQP